MWRPLAVASILIAAATNGIAGDERLDATIVDRPAAVASFTLTDQDGAAFTPERLKGHWSLLAIGYTSCPDLCPFTLGNLAAIVDEFASRPDRLPEPGVVFVAVDPARDEPVLKQWIEEFNPRFIGITGPDRQIAALVRALGGAYRIGKPDAQGRYDVAHSSAVTVIDPQGRVGAHLVPPMPPAQAAAFLARLMQDPQPTARADAVR